MICVHAVGVVVVVVGDVAAVGYDYNYTAVFGVGDDVGFVHVAFCCHLLDLVGVVGSIFFVYFRFLQVSLCRCPRTAMFSGWVGE